MQRLRIAILVSDGTEELDLAGPLEVLGAWSQIWPEDQVEVTTFSLKPAPVRCANGLVVLPRHTWATIGHVDVIIIPGGGRDLRLPHLARELRERSAEGTLICSVCTGVFALASAGLLENQAATTHHDFIAELGALVPSLEIRTDVRFVDAGHLITAAGVSAGIDMALHLIARLHSVERARDLASYIEWPTPTEASSATDAPRGVDTARTQLYMAET